MSRVRVYSRSGTPTAHSDGNQPGPNETQAAVTRGPWPVIGYGFIGRRVARAAVSPGLARARPQPGEEAPGEPVEVVVRLQPRTSRHWSRCSSAPTTSPTPPARPSPPNPISTPSATRYGTSSRSSAVLSAARSRRITGFSFLSSGGTVYGPDAPVPTREDAPLWPISSYGVMKIAAERYVAMYARQAGFAADLLRCANVFGPGEPTAGSQGLDRHCPRQPPGRPAHHGLRRRQRAPRLHPRRRPVRRSSSGSRSKPDGAPGPQRRQRRRPPRSPRSSTRLAGRTASQPCSTDRHCARPPDSPIAAARRDEASARRPGHSGPRATASTGWPEPSGDRMMGEDLSPELAGSSSPRPRRHALRTCRFLAPSVRGRPSRVAVVLDVGAGDAPYRSSSAPSTTAPPTGPAPPTQPDARRWTYVAQAHDLPLETATVGRRGVHPGPRAHRRTRRIRSWSCCRVHPTGRSAHRDGAVDLVPPRDCRTTTSATPPTDCATCWNTGRLRRRRHGADERLPEHDRRHCSGSLRWILGNADDGFDDAPAWRQLATFSPQAATMVESIALDGHPVAAAQ